MFVVLAGTLGAGMPAVAVDTSLVADHGAWKILSEYSASLWFSLLLYSRD